MTNKLKLRMPNGDVLTPDYPDSPVWSKSWTVTGPTGLVATGEQADEIIESYGLQWVLDAYREALMALPSADVIAEEVPEGSAEFLRSVSDRLFKVATPTMGFDQYDTDRLREIATALETTHQDDDSITAALNKIANSGNIDWPDGESEQLAHVIAVARRAIRPKQTSIYGECPTHGRFARCAPCCAAAVSTTHSSIDNRLRDDLMKLREETANSRQRWNSIAESGGFILPGMTFSMEEIDTALGVIDWIENKLDAILSESENKS